MKKVFVFIETWLHSDTVGAAAELDLGRHCCPLGLMAVDCVLISTGNGPGILWLIQILFTSTGRVYYRQVPLTLSAEGAVVEVYNYFVYSPSYHFALVPNVCSVSCKCVEMTIKLNLNLKSV